MLQIYVSKVRPFKRNAGDLRPCILQDRGGEQSCWKICRANLEHSDNETDALMMYSISFFRCCIFFYETLSISMSSIESDCVVFR